MARGSTRQTTAQNFRSCHGIQHFFVAWRHGYRPPWPHHCACDGSSLVASINSGGSSVAASQPGLGRWHAPLARCCRCVPPHPEREGAAAAQVARTASAAAPPVPAAGWLPPPHRRIAPRCAATVPRAPPVPRGRAHPAKDSHQIRKIRSDFRRLASVECAGRSDSSD